MSHPLNVLNWTSELANAKHDPEVGIGLALLAGGDRFASYVIELKPGAHVAEHYHPEGVEIYQILSGTGLMKTGQIHDGQVRWNKPLDVQAGDFFTIPPGVVHRLENNASERLILIATCSPTNLGYNRVVIGSENLESRI